MPVFLLLLLLLPVYAFGAGNPDAVPGTASEPVYGIIYEADVPVRLPDGVTVYADIYRPKAEGTFPVLLEGTAYEKTCSTEVRMATHTYFVPRGYVFVVWNVRGRFKSEGIFDLEDAPGRDGGAVIEWIASQPWANGKVGLVGKSFSGLALYQTAAGGSPRIKCGISSLTNTNAWKWHYRGGALEFAFSSYYATALLGWNMAEKRLADRPEQLKKWQNQYYDYQADQQSFAGILPLAGFRPTAIEPHVNLFEKWVSHPHYSGYWQALSPASNFEKINIPIMHVGGWHDIFLEDVFEAYAGMRSRAGTNKARQNQRLLVGPWYHNVPSFNQTLIGAVDYGPALRDPELNDFRLAFLDYWLKDRITPLFDEDRPVCLYTMAANQWRFEKEWPPKGKIHTLFLHPGDGRPVWSLNDGLLSALSAAADAQPQSYIYDPMDPVATRGGSGMLLFAYWPDGLAQYGQQCQNPIEKYSLTFTTDVLEEDMEIDGTAIARLKAASDCVDTDWVVRLCDVLPDQESLNVTEGILRARYRDSYSQPSLLEPDRIYDYAINFAPTNYVFKKGHRLRLVISSSSWPRYSRNMNVAEYPEHAKEWAIAKNTIFIDATNPSWLELPVRARGNQKQGAGM